VDLSDEEYEYRPPYYHEKICRTYGENERADGGNQVCFFLTMTEVLDVRVSSSEINNTKI
jgi:hypothetical protein